MTRRTVALMGATLLGLLIAGGVGFATTITYTLDGNLGEWSTSYPGYVDYADPVADVSGGPDPNWNHGYLDITHAYQSIGYLSTDPSNWYVLFGLETNMPFATNGAEIIRVNAFINDPRAGGGNSVDFPSLNGAIDDYLIGFITSSPPLGGDQALKPQGVQLTGNSAQYRNGAFIPGPSSFFAYTSTATKSTVEMAIPFSALGYWSGTGTGPDPYVRHPFTRDPAVPDPFGWAVTQDDADNLAPHWDISPNPGTGGFGLNAEAPLKDGNWNFGFTPEPATSALFLVGLLGLGAIRRRRS